METGLIVFAHGSRIESANEAVRAVVAEMARHGGFEMVETAFLEQAPPDLAQAVERLTARGASRIVVIPYFLTLGSHLQEDLPRLVEEAARRHPDVAVSVTPPLDGHPSLVRILLDRAREAVGGKG